MKDRSEKNPLFLPALIATLFSGVGLVFCYCGILIAPLFILMFIAPFAAIILSAAGLVDARKLHERFKGCVFCLVIAFLELLFLQAWFQAYLNRVSSKEPVPIQVYYSSPSEIESINEEVERIMKEKPERGTEK